MDKRKPGVKGIKYVRGLGEDCFVRRISGGRRLGIVVSKRRDSRVDEKIRKCG